LTFPGAFLARRENTIGAVVPIIRAVCAQPVEADGLIFDYTTVEGTLIKEDADYEGICVTFSSSTCSSVSARAPDRAPVGSCGSENLS
jgi:hypothetical protein